MATGPDTTELTEQERARLAAAPLPDDLPASDATAWAFLGVQDRDKVIRRLAVLKEWRARARRRSASGDEAAAAAEAAAISRRRFYDLLAQTEDRISLQTLGIVSGKPAGRPGLIDVAKRAAITQMIDEALEADPMVRTEEVLRRVAALEIDAPPARTTLLRWIGEARHRTGRGGPFGGRLGLDLAFLPARDDRGMAHVLCAFVDEGSGLLLGSAVVTEDSVWAGYRMVLGQAHNVLGELRLGRAPLPREEAVLQVSTGYGADPFDVMRLLAQLRSFRLLERHVPDTRAIRPLRNALGDRLGGVRLRWRPEDVPADVPVIAHEEVSGAALEAVELHNRLVLERIDGEEDLAHAQVRERLRTRLEDVLAGMRRESAADEGRE